MTALSSAPLSITRAAPFLRPAGFTRPPVAAMLRELSVVGESVRYAAEARRATAGHATSSVPTPPRQAAPVLLIPGFFAGDATLGAMTSALRRAGFRTYRSRIGINVGCTLDATRQLEQRLEGIVQRRGGPAYLVGHSLGGMLARGVAVRRPDLVAGLVTLGSPMLAPGAHHLSLAAGLDLLVRLSRAGVPGLMAEECVAGECARESYDSSRLPLSHGVTFTSVYSRRDGVVDWRACLDPQATALEVSASHLGMAIDPRVHAHVVDALRA
jgi:pimeloyl-ACP methyl ester carboxylesterase